VAEEVTFLLIQRGPQIFSKRTKNYGKDLQKQPKSPGSFQYLPHYRVEKNDPKYRQKMDKLARRRPLEEYRVPNPDD
jgi:hypothetical protein